MNLMWINVPRCALTYGENPNLICLSIQKLFKKQWRTFLKKLDISLLNYYRSLVVPDVHLVDDIRSWCHEHSALLCDPTLIHEAFRSKILY